MFCRRNLANFGQSFFSVINIQYFIEFHSLKNILYPLILNQITYTNMEDRSIYPTQLEKCQTNHFFTHAFMKCFSQRIWEPSNSLCIGKLKVITASCAETASLRTEKRIKILSCSINYTNEGQICNWNIHRVMKSTKQSWNKKWQKWNNHEIQINPGFIVQSES